MALQEVDKIWMNGELLAWKDVKIHVLTHALHYGSAVFEGIRCYDTEKGPVVFRLHEHIRRLFDSARIYKIKIPYTQDQICDAAKDTIRVNKLRECYIRPIAYYGYGVMGLNPKDAPVDVSIAVWPWGAYLGEEGLKKGIKCKISSWNRVDSRIMPPLAKASANYLNSIMAKLEAIDAGCDEAIVKNLNGMVAEGSGENIFIIKDGEVHTPGISSGILPGITRASVIEIARQEFELQVTERDILPEELYLADEIFLTGTAAEITPVREVDGRMVGSGSRGIVTEKLQNFFFDVVKGKKNKYAKWLDKV